MTQAILAALCATAPPEIARIARLPQRCVLATSVGCRVLAHFGIRAEPTAVAATVMNAAYAAWIESGGAGGAEAAHAAGAWAICYDPRAAECTIPGRRTWNGHMVIDLPTERALLDLDLQQFRRPAKRIDVGDVGLFPYGEHDWRRGYFMRANCRLVFRPLSDARWRHSGDWRADVRPTVGRIIRAIRAHLQEE